MNKPAILLAAALLSGCANETVISQPVLQPTVPVAVPQPQPLVLKNMEWKVYNLAELKKLVAQLEKNKNPNFVIFALTPDGYKALSSNMIEIERYVTEQKEVIVFMKKIINERATPNG